MNALPLDPNELNDVVGFVVANAGIEEDDVELVLLPKAEKPTGLLAKEPKAAPVTGVIVVVTAGAPKTGAAPNEDAPKAVGLLVLPKDAKAEAEEEVVVVVFVVGVDVAIEA